MRRVLTNLWNCGINIVENNPTKLVLFIFVMKKRIIILQKVIIFTVLIALLCTALLTGTVSGAQSKEMNTSLFYAKLAEFEETVYANGSKYKDNAKEYSGIQCYGFANQISKYIFGSFPCYYSGGTTPNKDWEINYGSAALVNLHVGDVVRYRSSVSADHSIFITGMDEEKVYFSDANNDHNNGVRHNAEMTWEKLISRIDKSLEIDSKLIGWVAHYKYWNDEPTGEGAVTVSYNVNGGYVDCEKVADRYVVITSALRMRADAGLDKEIITRMTNGKCFDIAIGAETVDADGYTWAPITFEGQSGWAAISDPGDVRPYAPVTDKDYYADGETGDILKNGTTDKYTQILYGENKTLSDKDKFNIAKDGAEFKGWALTPDGEPVTEVEPTENGEIVTLYAVWRGEDETTGEETAPDETTGEETTVPETTEPETTEPETTEPETTEPETTEPVHLPGDINGDGKENNKDVTYLFRMISANPNDIPPECDINGDGKINNKDVTYLFRYISS